MRITSSSIFSSRSSPPAFAATFLIASALVLAGILSLTVALDPYDTGRLALVDRPGVHQQGPRTANASRARDPRFEGAIIGNSHIQAVRPSALSAATGVPFVSLFITATGPQAQLAMLDNYLARHPRPPRALVLGIDGYWCTPDPTFPEWQPFPFWLYDPSDLAHLRGLLRQDTLDDVLQRLLRLTGKGKPGARPDGEASYEGDYTWQEPDVLRRLAVATPAAILNETGRFPMLERLGERLARLPGGTAIVAVVPPVHLSSLPSPGSARGRSDAACREALAGALQRHAASALVDWQVDRPEIRDPANFFDHSHYRAGLARAVEGDVAGAIQRLRGGGS